MFVTDELKSQVKSRAILRRKRQKEKKPELKQKLCDEILDLSDKIKYLKQEVINCEKIEEQTKKIKDNLRQMQEQEEQDKSRKKGDLEK